MEHTAMDYPVDKRELYPLLQDHLRAMTEDIPHMIANLANASALLYDAMEDINWVGFYLMEQGKLVLGPFQGKPACIEIEVGSGVCGTAVARDETVLVTDVHTFPGHIPCDSASNSEIVVPLHKNGQVVGVLDVDSPTVGRFTEEDRIGLTQLGLVLETLL